MNTKKKFFIFLFLLVVALSTLIYQDNFAHCDTYDGPVVKAANESLESGNINLVKIWIQSKDEKELQSVYEKTIELRKNPEAKEVAETYFFETVVRLHRGGENEPFTGIKAAGTDLGPVIPAGDVSIENGSTDKLEKLLIESVKDGLENKFHNVMHSKNYDKNDVEAGRKYVKAYVEFMHYIEQVHEVSKGTGHGHSEEDLK